MEKDNSSLEYYCVYKQYTGQVSVDNLSSEDENELEDLNIINGTTLKIPYDEEIHHLIKNNFTEERKYLKYHERLDVIFGRFNHTIELIDNIEHDNNSVITPYNYFSEPDTFYYKGINREKICVVNDNQSKNLSGLKMKIMKNIVKYYLLEEVGLNNLVKLIIQMIGK